MKSLIYRLVFIAFTFIFLLNSCENLIDLRPLDKIGNESYWKTSEDLRNYMKSFYPVFHPYTIVITQLAKDVDDMIHDNVPSNWLNGKETVRTGNWRSEWTNIRNVNIFFENYKRCKDDFNAYKHYLGEAHFFRAWFYFEKLRTYGDVPYYSTSLGINDEELYNPRLPRTQIADSILHDLDLAATYLKGRAELTDNNTISKEAALAFETRVALFEGTWQKYHANTPFGTAGATPAKYFQKCMSVAEELMSGKYKVGIYDNNKPNEDFYKLFGFDDMNNINEIILYRAFSRADGVKNSLEEFLTRQPNGYGLTWQLVTSFLGKDGNPYDYLALSKTNPGNSFLTQMANNCDPRLKSTVFIPGDLKSDHLKTYFAGPYLDQGGYALCPTGFQIKKTHNPYSAGAGEQADVGSETGMIILRYGEVLLNYAEAKCELDGSVATTQLNMLRNRAGMPDFKIIPQSSDYHLVNYGYTISDALYEIRRERRVEMALEGLRNMDLRRWRAHNLFKGDRPKGYPFVASEYPNVSFKVVLDANGLIDFYSKDMAGGYGFREKQDYLTSIPLDELTLNPKLTQNPEW